METAGFLGALVLYAKLCSFTSQKIGVDTAVNTQNFMGVFGQKLKGRFVLSRDIANHNYTPVTVGVCFKGCQPIWNLINK